MLTRTRADSRTASNNQKHWVNDDVTGLSAGRRLLFKLGYRLLYPYSGPRIIAAGSFLVDGRDSIRVNSSTEMLDKLLIRDSDKGDFAAIEALYPVAFPDENLLPLVRDLLKDTAIVISLAGTIDMHIVGHAIFTKCGVAGSRVKAALLGPLAVAPAWQRRGIGSAIVRAGLRRLQDTDVSLVCVLGDPAYYKRLGFLPESLVGPPFRLPAEWDGAWQSQTLGEHSVSCSGKLTVPRQWLEPELWAP